MKKGRIDKICLECNKSYNIVLSRKDSSSFCSKKCKDKYFNGENSPRWKDKIKRKCLYCGKIYEINVYRKDTNKFCSRICNTKYYGKLRKSLPKIKKVCLVCKKEFYVPLYRSKIKLCSIKCKNKYHSKQMEKINNPAWLGGKSFELYGAEFNRTLKETIRQRDNYKCQLCGVPQIECFRKLGIHHIDYNKKNNIPENLITLCDKCHQGTNYNRNYWESYFTKIEV